MLKQLSEQDASFLYLETNTTPQHVGGVSLIELPPGYDGDFYSTYKRHIHSRLHLIPFLHSKLVQLPFDIDRPFWVEDEGIDIDYHVRHHTLPKPGTVEQLEELVARIHSNFLDRSRPLWEFYVIDGLTSGHIAIYTKIHHAAMDGGASQLLLRTMYDPTPEPRDFPQPHEEVHHQEVGFQAIVGAMMKHMVQQEVRFAQWMPDVIKAWTNIILPNVNTLRYDLPLRTPHTPKSPFNVVITSQRVYAARSLPLPAVKQVAKHTGTKINDVVLAACSGALRRYLTEKALLPHETMTTLVPISLREGPPTDEVANQNFMFLCSLATDIEDPAERLQAISKSSTDQKRRIRGIKNALLPDLTFLGGGALLRGMVDLYTRAKLAERLPPLGNLTISNVPGPPLQLYVAGAKVVTMYPCSIPFHGAALNITCESYMDRLDFGLIACRRTVPDVALLGDYLESAFAELYKRCIQPAAAARAKAKRSRPAAEQRATAAKPSGRAKTSAKTSANTSAKTSAKTAARTKATTSARIPSAAEKSERAGGKKAGRAATRQIAGKSVGEPDDAEQNARTTQTAHTGKRKAVKQSRKSKHETAHDKSKRTPTQVTPKKRKAGAKTKQSAQRQQASPLADLQSRKTRKVAKKSSRKSRSQHA